MPNSRDKSLRDAFFQALDGQLSYEGNEVFLTDEKTEGDNRGLYVLFTNQTATTSPSNNFTQLEWQTTIVLQIVSEQSDSITKDIVDEISGQIEDIIIMNKPTDSGLIQQSGWEIIQNGLSGVSYGVAVTTTKGLAITKELTFAQLVTKL